MLLDSYDLDYMFRKKCYCFGAAVMAGATAAAGSTTLLAAGTATAANMALVGGLISTVGMIQQGQSQASQARFQAGVANNNAIIAQQQATRARQQAKIDAQDFSRGQSDVFGSRRALLGNTGVGATTGSPLSVSSDFGGESELNRKRIINQGFVSENRFQQEAMNQRAQAGLFAASGKQAVTGSLFKAGGQLFKTGQDVFSTPGVDKAFQNFGKKTSSFPKATGTEFYDYGDYKL